MRFIYTDGNDPDFIELCRGLDSFLMKLQAEKKTGQNMFCIESA